MRRVLQRVCQPLGLRLAPNIRTRPRFTTTIDVASRENSSSTFVSRHHVLQPSDVAAFLDQRGLDFRISGGEVVVKECPFCHDIGGKLDNMWKLYIGMDKG